MSKEISNVAREVIHCRASSSGQTLGTSNEWKMGEEVKFMWMPAGVSTITAGITRATAQGMVNKSVNMTVICDKKTAEIVQASLEEWLAERPKQKPYGCVEHREQEATVLAKGFEWKEGEEDGGVYLAAEPTALGVSNVNGKIHRSWSPSFTTDAETSKAVEKNGVLFFPPGVRGSASNPARIIGVDFVVGTLTNKPAFRNMSPVKASDHSALLAMEQEVIEESEEEVITATWSDAARKAALEARKAHASVQQFAAYGDSPKAKNAADRVSKIADEHGTRSLHKLAAEAHMAASGSHDPNIKGTQDYTQYHLAEAKKHMEQTKAKVLSNDEAEEYHNRASKAGDASRLAYNASAGVPEKGGEGDHKKASALHQKAAQAHREAGEKSGSLHAEEYHEGMASQHEAQSEAHNKGEHNPVKASSLEASPEKKTTPLASVVARKGKIEETIKAVVQRFAPKPVVTHKGETKEEILARLGRGEFVKASGTT
jgi:hypothetical protein